MKKSIILIAALTGFCGSIQAKELTSPDKSITVSVTDTTVLVSKNGSLVQTLYVDMPGKVQGKISRKVKTKYNMLSGKRSRCLNVSNDCSFKSESGTLEIKVFNDGIAYRICGINGDAPQHEYIIPEGTKRWMQSLKTDYEGFYPMSEKGQRGKYGYPALFEYSTEGVWGLVTESDVTYTQSGSYLVWNAARSSYTVVNQGDPHSFEGSKYPERRTEDISDRTPWRVLILGTLAQVVESTLVTDVAQDCKIEDTSWIRPGVSAWIYWAYNHSSKDYAKVKEYIDLAVEMHWPYNLIDWEWDVMENGGNIEDALKYAASKGVKANLWYNSGTSWIGNGAPGPQDRLLTAQAREKEMTRLEELGATGIKVDFFLPDGPDMIDYYLDILSDAARHHLLVDFHGCTVPRGWSRTWPNLMSMESVYGAEWYNNNRRMTNAAPAHNATLPFTRNVIGPMDYTPCTFTDSQNPHITSDCHELALPILFESGLQHMADRPESYLGLPQQVKQLLQNLPSAWDDTRLLAGYPGETAVFARQKDGVWYIAGINGTGQTVTVKPDYSRIGGLAKKSVMLFTDMTSAPGGGFNISESATDAASIELPANGGFVMTVK